MRRRPSTKTTSLRWMALKQTVKHPDARLSGVVRWPLKKSPRCFLAMKQDILLVVLLVVKGVGFLALQSPVRAVSCLAAYFARGTLCSVGRGDFSTLCPCLLQDVDDGIVRMDEEMDNQNDVWEVPEHGDVEEFEPLFSEDELDAAGRDMFVDLQPGAAPLLDDRLFDAVDAEAELAGPEELQGDEEPVGVEELQGGEQLAGVEEPPPQPVENEQVAEAAEQAADAARQRQVQPATHTWGAFRITWVAAGASQRWGAWQGTCRYHAGSAKTKCTKRLTVLQEGAVDETLQRIRMWLLQANLFIRKDEHTEWNPRVHAVLPPEIMEAELLRLPAPPDHITTDSEMDAAARLRNEPPAPRDAPVDDARAGLDAAEMKPPPLKRQRRAQSKASSSSRGAASTSAAAASSSTTAPAATSSTPMPPSSSGQSSGIVAAGVGTDATQAAATASQPSSSSSSTSDDESSSSTSSSSSSSSS